MNSKLFILALLILYLPNQLHFPQSLGLPGLNLLNVLFIFALLIHIRSKDRKKKVIPAPLKSNFIYFFIILFVAFLVAQMNEVQSIVNDVIQLKTAIFYMLFYFLFYHALNDKKEIEKLFLFILIIVSLAALEVIWEAYNYGFGGSYNLTHRASGPFGHNWRNANRAGVFFTIYVPFILALILYPKVTKIMKLAGMASFVLVIFAIFFTYSRQAMLIVALVTLLMAFKYSKTLALVVLLSVLNYSLWAPDTVTERISETSQVDERGEEVLDKSTESRFIIWSGALDMALENPWGIGLNRFKSEIGNYTIYKNIDAHNHYMLILAEAGFIGVFLMVKLIISLFSIGKGLSRIEQPQKHFAYAYNVSVISLLMGNMYGSPFFYGELVGLFWIITAMAAKYSYLSKQETA